MQSPGSGSGGQNTSSPAAPSSSGLSWVGKQQPQSVDQPIIPNIEPESPPADEADGVVPITERSNQLNPNILRFPNNFNFAQQSDPEAYNQFELQKQRQSERLSRINEVYDTAQGKGAVKKNQDIKDNYGLTIPLDERSGNRATYVYNKLLNGVGELAAAVGDIGATVMAYSPQQGYSYNANNQVAPRTPEEINKQKEILTDYRKDVAGKVRSFVTDNLGAEVDDGLEAKYDNEFLTSSIGGLANSLPAMLLPAPIRTAGFILQGYDAGIRSVEANDPNGELDDLTKTLYATGVGTVGGMLERLGFEKLVGPGSSRLALMLTNKSLKDAVRETGGKVTGNLFERAIKNNVKEFANAFAKRGINAAEGFLIEAGTGGAQEIMNVGAEYLLNASTGKPIFDTKDMSTWEGFADNLKRVGYAAAQEGVGGGVIRGILNPKTRKSLDADQQTLESINDELENPELSPATKETLVRQKIELNENIETATLEAEAEFNKLSDDQKQQVSELGDRLDGVAQALEDPNLSEDLKSVLQKQSDDLTKQIEEIKPEVEDTLENRLKEAMSGDTVTFTYNDESEVPDALSGKHTSVGVTNGKKTVRVTLSRTEAENLLKQQSEEATPGQLQEYITQAEEIATQHEQLAEIETDPVEKQEALDIAKNARDLIANAQQELTEIENEVQPAEEVAPETVSEARNEEVVDKVSFAVNEINRGAINWDGDMLSPRPVLDLEWKDIRKGKQDLLDGKDTAAARRLTEAIDKAKMNGGYEFVTGSGKITNKQFVPMDGTMPIVENLTDSELNDIAKNEDALATEYDEFYNSLSESDKQNEIDFINKTYENTNKSGESEKNVSNQEDAGKQKTTGTETQKSVRTVAEVESDLRKLIARYHDELKMEGLYDLAKEEKADPADLAAAKLEAEKDFGKTGAELQAELEVAKKNESLVTDGKPEPVAKPKKSRDEMTLSEKIRSLKTTKGKAYDSILGVPVAIYDGALETIATAIEAGTSIKEAIKKAVAYIKKNSNVKDDVLIEEEINKSFEDAGILLKGLQQENVMPEVIEEIEKSAEEITQENIEAFKKNLHKIMTSAKTKTIIKSGVVKASLATDAMKKITEIVDRKTMLAANRAVKKVFGDIIRNAYISQIKQAKNGLKTRLKGSRLANTDLMKSFLKINESKLEIKDLEQYNAMVRLLNDQYNARLDSLVSDPELQKFVDYIADKNAKQILDDQITEAETEEDADAEPKVSGRRKQLEAAVAINRAELRKGGYDPAFKEVASALLNADTTTMTNAEMRDLNLALINLAVNNRLVSHEKVFRDYVGEKGMISLQSRIGNNVRGLLDSILAASVRSFDVNSKIIFKGVKDSSLFQFLSGIAGISNGNSQVANIDMKALENNYKSFINGLKFPDYNTTNNRFLRALYSNATQFAGIETESKDFTRYKSLIKQSADKLTTSTDPVEQREGQLRLQQYNEYLDQFENREDFENNFKQKQPKNSKVVDFFRQQFNNRLPEMKLNTLIYGGKNLKEVNNYLPMSWKMYSGTRTESDVKVDNLVEPIYDFDPESGEVSERQSSTTIDRTNKSKIKDTDRILNMDFDRYIFDKYREMSYDIRTLKDRHLYNSIKDQDGFKDIVGSQTNANTLTKGVVNMVKRQMNSSFNKEWEVVLKWSRALSAKAVRQAIFGGSQLIKQYPSVALRTLINLNTDMDLFFRGVSIGMDNPIFDSFGVGLRSTTKGGTNYEMELNNIRKADFSTTPGKIWNALNRVSQITADKLSKPLSYSDDAVAKHSWLAYYMKHIRDNSGDISKIDWQNEYLNPNMEAGAFADLMVSTTQNVNDNAKQADKLYDEGDAKTILRNIIIPFGSFARNAQANMEADIRTFSEGTAAEKRKAAVGLVATVAEQTAFNAIKVLVISNIINNGAAAILNSIGGDDDDDRELGFKIDAPKILTNTLSDLVLGGFGQVGSNLGVWGTNSAYKAISGSDKDLMFQYNPANFGEPNFQPAGIYGIYPQTIYSASEKFRYATGTVNDVLNNKKGDQPVYSKLSKKDQRLSLALAIMDGLALVGLSDADLSRMNQVMFRDIKKRNQPVKELKIEYLNKKADVIKK